MAIFAFNTTKKPSIPYIVSAAVATLFSFLSLISSISILNFASSTEFAIPNSMTPYIFNLVTAVLYALMLLVALIYIVLIRDRKKASKLSRLWSVFCVPSVIYVITYIASVVSANLNTVETPQPGIVAEYTPILVPAFITWISTIGFALAFVFAAMQFAKASKIPAVEEAPEITE